LLGEPDAARRAYREFELQFQHKIAFGREPEPGEALRWAVQVEPFRRIEDSRKMPDVLREAGLVAIDVETAIAARPNVMVQPANIRGGPGSVFRPDGNVWDVQFEGVGARLIALKGFHDLARLLREPDVRIHCRHCSRWWWWPGHRMPVSYCHVM